VDVPYRDLVHQLLYWFVSLADTDARKQLLVNIMLQLHEACYNCIGRHKEVFEYCVHDLIEAEAEACIDLEPKIGASARMEGSAAAIAETRAARAAFADAGLDRSRRAVCRHAAMFLDRHKRNALQASVLAPLKFIFQNDYKVVENIDSHGASFWATMLVQGFLPGFEMPSESIEELDTGWTWGSVDFLELMRKGDAAIALERLSAFENLGRDWRQLTRGLKPPCGANVRRLPGLPLMLGFAVGPGFVEAVEEVKRPNTRLKRALEPYAERFVSLMMRPVLLRACTIELRRATRSQLSFGATLAKRETILPRRLGTRCWALRLRPSAPVPWEHPWGRRSYALGSAGIVAIRRLSMLL